MEQVLKKFEDEKLALARGLCERPVDTLEKYMRIVGEYQGLEKAKQMLLESVRDERQKDDER